MTPTRARRRTDRSVAAIVLAAAVALTGIVGPGADAADPGQDVVYVATGRSFPDALGGSVLAALNGAPLLFVDAPPPFPDRVPSGTAAELTRLAPIGRIVVFGGEAAVSDSVVTALADFTTSGTVDRVAGGDRFDTAAEIARLLPAKAKDADLLDGLDSGAFARSGQVCTPGDFVTGIGTDGLPVCAAPPAAGGDADTLDGLDSSDFENVFATIDLTGGTLAVLNDNGLVSAVKNSVGDHTLTFDRPVNGCAWLGTIGARDGGVASGTRSITLNGGPGATDPEVIRVRTELGGVVADVSFNVGVLC